MKGVRIKNKITEHTQHAQKKLLRPWKILPLKVFFRYFLQPFSEEQNLFKSDGFQIIGFTCARNKKMPR